MTRSTGYEKLFRDEDLVAYANRLLEDAGSGIRASSVVAMGDRHVSFRGAGPRGGPVRLVAPMGTYRPGLSFFRSVLRIVDPRREANWLVNGQSGTNTREIVHLGESGSALSTTSERLRGYLFDGVESVDPSRAEAFRRIREDQMSDAERAGWIGSEVAVMRWTDGDAVREPLHTTEPTSGPQA